MDAPPPGYNPTESLLQGGNASIVPVMGGGGGGGGLGGWEGGALPPEQVSLLEGGNSANIIPVKGGGLADDEDDLPAVSMHHISETPYVSTAIRIPVELIARTEEPEPEPIPLPSAPIMEVVREVVETIRDPIDDLVWPEEEDYDLPVVSPVFLPITPYIASAIRIHSAPPVMTSEPPIVSEVELTATPFVATVIRVESAPVVPISSIKAKKATKQKQKGFSITPLEIISSRRRVMLPNLTDKLKKLVKSYTEKQLRLWKRHAAKGKQESAAKPMRQDTCSAAIRESGILDDVRGEGGFDRLAVFLPKSVKTIVVLPAIYGIPAAYAELIASMEKYIDDSACAILFSPPFYGLLPTDRNLFANFLTDKARFKAKLYALAHSTTQSLLTGCLLDPEYLHRPSSSYVYSLLEPTYVIYPYEGGLVFSGAAEDEAALPVSSSKAVSSVSETSQKGSIAFPPSLYKEDTIDFKVYRLVGNTDAIVLECGKTAAAAEQTGGGPGRRNQDKFLPTPDADLVMEGVIYGHLSVGLDTFVIREPSGAGARVYDDWLQMRYTSDEADFLNELSLRPSILENIWPNGDWKAHVADFMKNIVISECFTDLTLLTDNECQVSRDFMDKAMKYFLLHDERIMHIKKRASLNDAIAEAMAGVASSKTSSVTNPFTGEGAAVGASILSGTGESIKQQIIKTKNDGSFPGVKAVGDGTVIFSLKDPDNYSRQVFAINTNTNEYRQGMLTVNEPDPTNVTTALTTAFDKLSKDYPDWKFII
jgi:hypothetical protein